MRYLKYLSVILITLFIVLSIAFNARISIINNLLKSHLSSINTTITCLDFNVSNNTVIEIEKLCLHSPQANFVVQDTVIHWKTATNFSITNIDVESVEIHGNSPLFSHSLKKNHDNNQIDSLTNVNKLLSDNLKVFNNQIKQLNLPQSIIIHDVLYYPFKDNAVGNISHKTSNNKVNTLFKANVSYINDVLILSLKNAENISFFNGEYLIEKDNFSLEVNGDLSKLQHFFNAHQLPINEELKKVFNEIKLSGNINVLIDYKTNKLIFKHYLSNLLVTSDTGINASGAFKVFGALNFKTELPIFPNINEIPLTFLEKNYLHIKFNKNNLVSMLEKTELPTSFIKTIKMNSIKNFLIETKGSGEVQLNNRKVLLSDIEVSIGEDKEILNTKIENTIISLSHEKKSVPNNKVPERLLNASNLQIAPTVAIEKFSIHSQLKLHDLAKFSGEPAMFQVFGSMNYADNNVNIDIAEQSTIALQDIKVKSSNTQINEDIFTLNSLNTMIKGRMKLWGNNKLSFDLSARIKGEYLQLPNKLNINNFALISDINGNPHGVKSHTNLIADSVRIGSVNISGPINDSKIELVGNKLKLTDILSLNIKIPTDIKIIEGTLSYGASSDQVDLKNIEQSDFNGFFEIDTMSGEVDGVWIQGFNWRQKFTLHDGNISTLHSVKDNLTIDLIESFSSVSAISLNTSWTFEKSFKFSANEIKGNAFGGQFAIPKLYWPFEHGHSANVQLSSIDLEQVLALDKTQGIVVTGNISGQLPVKFDGDKFMIENGKLHNISNGLIQVKDNPAVANLKANNSQLQLALDALQNLHYHQLSSDISMKEDGYMQLETIIKGRNPDIDNDVNLNLNLSYDLLGLLESLSITDSVEKSIIKGFKNKE